MRILNPFQMNDWGIKNFLIVVLGLQAAVWVVVALDVTLGWQVPFIRQLFGILYLLFIPGMLILRVFRLHNLGAVKSLLFSVGLSVATVMFIGLLMNTLYPYFGITQPITILPLTITFSVVVLLLCILSYFRDRGFSNPEYLNINVLISPPALLLYLLPFLSIIGTFLVNQYQSNILLMILIAVIALIVILVGFKKFIPEELYPLAIFCIVLSLLFFRSLISFYVSGYDIHEEFASAALVQSSGYWESLTPSLVNGLLAINILPVTVSDISGLSLTILFKTFYPLLFAFACIGLYQVFKKQTNALVAFFAIFFIVSAGRMYYDLALIPRQLTASLFLIVSLVMLIERDISEKLRVVFLTIMGFAIVLSHYGLAYIYMAILLCSTVIQWLARNIHIQRFWNGVRSRLSGSSGGARDTLHEMKHRSGIADILFVFLFIVITFAWYLYTAGGSPLKWYGYNVNIIIQHLTGDFFSLSPVQPITAEALQMTTENIVAIFNQITGYLKEILVIIGIFALIWSIRREKMSRSYLFLCIIPVILFIATLSSRLILPLSVSVVFLVCVAFIPALRRKPMMWLILILIPVFGFSVLFPQIAAKIVPFSLSRVLAEAGRDMDRMQHIAILFLAPFFVIGAIAAIDVVNKMFTKLKMKAEKTVWVVVTCVFLGFTLLLETGFIWQAMGNYTVSPSLNQAWISEHGDVPQKAGLYCAVTPEQDVISAEWLKANMTLGANIYATFSDMQVHPLTSYGLISVDNTKRMSTFVQEIPGGSYIYLQYLNTVEGIVDLFHEPGTGQSRTYLETKDLDYLWHEKNKIYTNGGSEIYE